MNDEPGRYRILGIDPGLASVGWGVVEVTQGTRKLELVGFGVIETAAGMPLPYRLKQIFEGTQQLIEAHCPKAMVVEQLFFARNAKTAMVVAHGRAASILAAGTQNVEVVEYTPLQLKLALTGRGSAGKAQVQAMVRAVLGLEAVPEPDHAADALAAAVCHAHQSGFRQAVARRMVRERRASEDKADLSGGRGVGGEAEERERRKALLSQSRRRR